MKRAPQVSSDASKAALLMKDTAQIDDVKSSDVKTTVLGKVIMLAEVLISKEESSSKPNSVKVYYRQLPFGDVSPAPTMPKVFDARNRERAPTEEEIEFATEVANMLPMYDVTLRVDERKEVSSLSKFAFGAVDATLIGANDEAPRLDYNFDSAPFASWRAAVTLPAEARAKKPVKLSGFVSQVGAARYNAGEYAGAGYVTFRSGKKEVSGRFEKVVMFDEKRAGALSGAFCTKIMFFSTATMTLRRADTILTFRHEKHLKYKPILEMRSGDDGKLKRVCFPFNAVLRFDSSASHVGAPTLVGGKNVGFMKLFETPLVTPCPPAGIAVDREFEV